ncbi:MAG: hypothetical protein OXC19_21695 [Bryobacterales bacterium]|nr:hypothetical protein [Bryobacterales bacterium]
MTSLKLSTIRDSGTVAGLHSWPVAIPRLLFLASIACPVLAGPGGELFSERRMGGGGSGTPLPSDEGTIRSRGVEIDLGRLAEVRDALLRKLTTASDAQSNDGLAVTLLFNLFDDATYTGVVERTGTTSAGYSLSGRIQETEFSSFDLVVNGEIVFGEVTTPQASYWIRSGPGVEYWVSEIDPESFAPHEDDVLQ